MVDSEPTLKTIIKDQLHFIPRETFLFPKTSERKFLADTINSKLPLLAEHQLHLVKLAQHQDYIVGETALNILRKRGDALFLAGQINELKPLIQNHDFHRRQGLALLMRTLDDHAFPIIDELLKDENSWVKRTAIASLANKTFEEANKRLMDLWASETNDDNRRMIITTIGDYNNPEVDKFLRQARESEGETKAGREAAQIILRKNIERSPNQFEFITSHIGSLSSDLEIFELSSAIASLKEKGTDLINEIKNRLQKEVNPKLKRLVEMVELDWAMNSWIPASQRKTDIVPVESDRQKLLWGKKPLFASENPKDTIQLLNEIGEFIEEMKKEYGDKLIGIIMYGSTGEGFRTPDSDSDSAILVKDSKIGAEIAERINSRFKDKWARDQFSVTIDFDDKMGIKNHKLLAYLFQGIFLGNKIDLDKGQLESISRLDANSWDEVRRELEGMLSGPHTLGRLKERHNLEVSDPFVMEILRKLLRIPPNLETTKNILRKRVR